jgi:hypothetical protein
VIICLAVSLVANCFGGCLVVINPALQMLSEYLNVGYDYCLPHSCEVIRNMSSQSALECMELRRCCSGTPHLAVC